MTTPAYLRNVEYEMKNSIRHHYVDYFTIIVVNLHTDEHPIYKAVCTNGFGSGVGNTIDQAVRSACENIQHLAKIHQTLNISFDLISEEEYKKTHNAMDDFGVGSFDPNKSDWDSNCLTWVRISVSDMLKGIFTI